MVYFLLGRIPPPLPFYTPFYNSSSLEPEDSKTFKVRGIAYYELGNYKQAIGDFEQAISFSPQDGELYHLRGICYEKNCKNDKAEQDFIIARKKGYKNIKS